MLNLLFHHFQLVFESQIPKSAQIHWPFHKPSHLQLEDLQDLNRSPRVEVFSLDICDIPRHSQICQFPTAPVPKSKRKRTWIHWKWGKDYLLNLMSKKIVPFFRVESLLLCPCWMKVKNIVKMVPVNLNLILMRYWMGCFMVFKLQCLNLVAVLAVHRREMPLKKNIPTGRNRLVC